MKTYSKASGPENRSCKTRQSPAFIAFTLLLIGLLLFPWTMISAQPLFPEDSAGPFKAGTRVSFVMNNGKNASSANPPAKTEITLDEAISKAMENNPDLKSSGYDVQGAMALEAEARSGRFPVLSARGAYAHWLDDQRLLPARYNGEGGVFSDDLVSADLILQIPLYAGGKIINGIKAAELNRLSAENRLARTREELAFNVSSVFNQILSQRQLVTFLEFSKEALENHLKRVNALIDGKKAAPVDRLKMEVAIADVTQKLTAENHTMSILHHFMANLMGMAPGASSFSIQGSLEEPARPDLVLKEVDTVVVLEKRADYQALEKELAAQEKRVDMARGDDRPTVSALGAYGGRWALTPDNTPPGLEESGDTGQIGLGFQMPLFEGGRTRARILAEQVKRNSLKEKLRKLELQIRLELETARANLISAYERTKTLEKSMASARESLRIEREKYELGKGTILDVLDAQSDMLEAETTYTRVLADYHIANAQNRLALGGAIE
jgi:outer membrane protein TolC